MRTCDGGIVTWTVSASDEMMKESKEEILSLQCDNCEKLTRTKSEFYQHLTKHHHIKKGLEVCYARALEQHKSRGQRRKLEEIILEDSDEVSFKI